MVCGKRASKMIVPPKEMLHSFSLELFWLTMMSQLESNILHCTKKQLFESRNKSMETTYSYMHDASNIIVNRCMFKKQKKRSVFVGQFLLNFFLGGQKMYNFLHYFATNLTQEHDLAWLCVTNPKSWDVCSQHFLLLKSNFTYI